MVCLACDIAQGVRQPPGGFIYESALWTVNHVISDVPWRGWLVLQPRRHVERLHELTPEEMLEYAQVLTRLDHVLREQLDAAKVYICLFAESADCPHVHFHVIPRYAAMTQRGPEIFEMEKEERPAASPEEVVILAARLRAALEALER